MGDWKFTRKRRESLEKKARPTHERAVRIGMAIIRKQRHS
jgi:hypothetical protein